MRVGPPVDAIVAGDGDSIGRGLEALIPWEALPPLRELALRELRLRLDLGQATGPDRWRRLASTALARGGSATAGRRVRLARARRYFITPCRYDLRAAFVGAGPSRSRRTPSDEAVAYYIPGRELDVREVIVLDNPARGYAYVPVSVIQEPATADTVRRSVGRSPSPARSRYFAEPLGESTTLCGPELAVARDGRVVRSSHRLSAPERVAARPLGGGGWLVRDGPRVYYSHYGSGQCGACPRVGLSFYHIPAAGDSIVRTYRYTGITQFDRGIDIHLARDWSRFTIYELRFTEDLDEVWGSVTHCRVGEGPEFRECDRREAVPEPRPRRLEYPERP